MSSFVFAQDVTSKVNLRLNIVDKISFSVYCGLSHVFESAGERAKCNVDNWKVVTPAQPIVRAPVVAIPTPTQVPVAVENTAVATVATSTPAAVVATETQVNPVLAEIQKKLSENTEAISKLEDKTSALERRATGQTIVKYVSGGSRGPKGADGVTTVVYATPTPTMFNNLSGSILIGENNTSFANNNISIGRGIVNTIDGSLQIGPSDIAKVTLTAGTSSDNMTVLVPGRIVATSFCIADMCIDANVISKVVDTFK